MNGSKTYEQAMLELTTCPYCKKPLEARADVVIRYDRKMTLGPLGFIIEQNTPNVRTQEYDFRCLRCNLLIHTGVPMVDSPEGGVVVPACDDCGEGVYQGIAVERNGVMVFLCEECQ